MSTHGDVLVIDKENQKGQWLHAYSDGHPSGIYEFLKELPEFFVNRAKLAKQLEDPSLGHGWMIDQFSENHWDDFLSVICGAWSSTISGLIVNRYLDRWLPINEEDAPWHTVGKQPDFKVICDGDGYDIIPSDDLKRSDEEDFEEIRIEYLDRLKELFKEARRTK